MYKNSYIYSKGNQCKDCGKSISNKAQRCNSCASKANFVGMHPAGWKGGRSTDQFGYTRIFLYRDDFFYPMTQKGREINVGAYVYEHRLVIARHLGRLLKRDEAVHHINGIKHDNRLENLVLLNNHKHQSVGLIL